ncbi:MAG: hypothetical protein ACTSSG_13630 [Candidatus Heimdallarchaeaceae archaeon]
MIVEIFSAVSLIISLIAIFIAIWHGTLSNRTLHTQNAAQLKELSLKAEHIKAEMILADLPEFKNYEDFRKSISKEHQELILRYVDFLNYAAHLVEEKAITRQLVWNRYFIIYRICYHKLLPWWLEFQNSRLPQQFSAFRRMCSVVGNVSDRDIIEFDQRLKRKNEANIKKVRKGKTPKF